MEVERSIQNIQLDDKQLLDLVHKAFPKCHRIDGYKILSGGALNTTYKLQIGEEELILRLYARDRANCKMEKEIHALIDGKVLTPNLIFADETHQLFPYAFFQFIEGDHISEVSRKHKTPLSYELGRVLASIHAFKFQQAGLFGEGIIIDNLFADHSRPYFEETFSILSKGKYVRPRLGDKLTDDMLEFIQKNQNYFPKVEKNICLTHSDFKPVNLLYNADKIYVLDWEFAHAGIGILDFAILLRHRDQFPLNLDALISGYLDFEGTLPEEWLRSAFITDFVNIVQMLDAPQDRPQLFYQLKNAAQTTLDYWDSLSSLFDKSG